MSEKPYDAEKHAAPSVTPTRESEISHGELIDNTVTPRNGFKGKYHDFIDGFKPANIDHVDTTGMTETEILTILTSRAPLKRKLKNRHLQMIAIGGSIGSGLFIGSGNSFVTGGPAGVVIGFAVIGIMLFGTMHALGELAVRFPVQGSFAVYSTRFLSRSWGFAMGWNYALQWLVVFPLELVAAAVVLDFWDPDNNGATRVNKAAWVSLFYVVILFINVFGVRGYGEAEFLFSIIKIIAVVGFCLFGIIVTAGGGPDHTYHGAHTWHDPGSFADGAKGVFSTLVNAAFAFGGTELSGLAAAETENPAKALPRAIKQVFWRILLFYIVSLTIASMMVPYTDPRLGASSDGSASPFVIAIEIAGVSGLPSVMNAVIIIAVLSVANASVYGCSRTLAALAAQHQAPKILGYIDREGRPLVGVGVTLIFGLLCFLAATPKHGVVFDWLLALSGLSSIFTWGSICLCHIRYRRGMRVHGHSTDELVFKAGAGVFGSWVGFGINVAVIGLQFWVALWPVGGSPNASDFFQAYLSVPVVIAFYIIAKIWYRDWSWFIHSKDMDVVSGMRTSNFEEIRRENEKERERIRSKGIIYRIYKFWC